MTKEQYMEKRTGLMNQAKELIDKGDLEAFKEKRDEVEALDARFENEAKALADLEAMNGKAVKIPEGMGKPGDGEGTGASSAQDEDRFSGMDYRVAFMKNVLKGEPIPERFKNADANTKTTDIGSVIPTTVLEKIIEKLESVGMILPLVTRTAIKGGVQIPTSTVKPVASWVAEGKGSDRQKKTTGNISFAYHKLRCAVSVSLEVDTMALTVFETTLINNVVEAMTKALEQAIIDGDGSGKPKGILSETVNDGQNIDVAKADKFSYQTLVDAEAALPLAYENGAVWFMTKATFMKFVGMVDSNKQPIARVNYGIGGRPERMLLGRQVILNDYMSSYTDSPTADTVVAFMFNPKDYVLNTNYSIGVKKYEDNDTDDMVTKAIMIVDGKVVDKNSLVTITKKNA